MDYFGLTPSKYQSGEVNRTGAISRCGDEMMRMILYEAAQILLVRSTKWSWLKAWAMKIARHRGLKKAIVALARRLAVTCRRQSAGKAVAKIVPLRPQTPCRKGLGADSEEKREPVSYIDTAVVDSLKALDLKPSIREGHSRFWRPSRQAFTCWAMKFFAISWARSVCGPG